jgi:hypothetical protein
VQECCKRAWLACAIDSEGSIQVWRQSSSAVSTRAFGIRVVINNSDDAYVARTLEILGSIDVNNWTTARRTSAIGTKDVVEIKIGELNSIIKVLEFVVDDLTVKKGFAEGALALAFMRRSNRDEHGERAPWTDVECEFAEQLRKKFMPNSCAYGETLPACEPRVIPSEASGSASRSTEEPLERRGASSTSSNRPHECPASQVDDDVRRSSGKPESQDNNPGEDIATA